MNTRARNISSIGIYALGFLVVLLTTEVSAQHTPQFSQYMYNTLAFNPAFAGSERGLSASLVHRTQWTSLPDAPKTQTIGIHAPMKDMNSGIGLIIHNDNIGVTSTSGVYFNYAYMMRTQNGHLALGLRGGASFFKANWSEIITTNSGDPAFLANSPLGVFPNFGTGLYYHDKQFSLGVAIPELLTHSFDELSEKVVRRSGMRNLMVTGSVKFELSERIDLMPSVLLKRNWTTGPQLSLGANVSVDDIFTLGLAQRTQDATIALFSIQLNEQFRMGYSYDFTFSALRKFSSGSHEIMLQYKFGYSNYSMNPRSFF